MALDELVSNRQRVPFLSYIKVNLDVLHLFRDGISSQSVAIFLVQRQSLINCLWKLNPKLHHFLRIFLCTALPDFSDNLILLHQHVLHPSVELRIVINILHDLVLRRLHQVALFQVSQPLPGCALVFTENTNIPAIHVPFLSVSSVHRYLLTLRRHRLF